MCVVTLDPEDHHGANLRFIYFLSCWVTNSCVALVCVYGVTFVNMTSHPCIRDQKYHSGHHADNTLWVIVCLF